MKHYILLLLLCLIMLSGCETNESDYEELERALENTRKQNIELRENVAYHFGRYVTSYYFSERGEFPTSQFMDSAFKCMPSFTHQDLIRIENSIK